MSLNIDLLICLRYVVFESNGVPITLVILTVGHQGWCYRKSFVLPLCPVLTMSRGFAVGPGQLSGIVFIMNDGDAGLVCFRRSR